MKCLVCNRALTNISTTTVLLERGHISLTIKNVPARVCPYCGEAYADEAVCTNLLRQAEELARAGSKVTAREYAQMEDV